MNPNISEVIIKSPSFALKFPGTAYPSRIYSKDVHRQKHTTRCAEQISDSLHMSYDVRIRTFLEEPVNGSLKYPKSKDDYIGLVKLIADDSPDDFWGESTDVLMGRIRRKYMDGEPAVWSEFKMVLDKCLEYGRFRDIRLLGMLKSRVPMPESVLTGIKESFIRICLEFARST